ncbi:MAG: chitobiase/beta-hexosaminidase C-terminal domain-containing protein, partial [Hominilimicola sp.]
IYTSPIELNETRTIKALAVKEGYTNSDVAEQTIEIISNSEEKDYDYLTFDMSCEFENDYAVVSMSANDSNAAIYYTLDLETPTDDSEMYTGPFFVYEDTTIKAIAVLGDDTSNLKSMEVTFNKDEFYEDEDEYEGEEYSEEYDEEFDNADFSYDSLISSKWAAEEIAEALEQGLIPNLMINEDLTKVITREKFAAIAVYLYQKLSGNDIDFEIVGDITDTPFTDCYFRESDYLKFVTAAYDLGLICGVTDTEFAPETAISREDLAVMLGRVVKKCMYKGWSIENDSKYPFDISGVQPFADDKDISEYAKESVYFMAKNGIVFGIYDSRFAPRNITEQQKASGYATSTKEQAILISLRCYKNLSPDNVVME